MKSIFDISKDYLELSESLVEAGGEVTPELEKALTLNKEELQAKGVNYGFVVKQLEGEAEIIEAEIRRLQQQKKYRENAVERLKQTLSGAMRLHGIEEIKTPLLKISFRRSCTVEVDDVKLIPSEYIKTTVTTSPDKKAIKEALEAGGTVLGASLVEHQNLQVK